MQNKQDFINRIQETIKEETSSLEERAKREVIGAIKSRERIETLEEILSMLMDSEKKGEDDDN